MNVSLAGSFTDGSSSLSFHELEEGEYAAFLVRSPIVS
jgi:hypothetical protein